MLVAGASVDWKNKIYMVDKTMLSRNVIQTQVDKQVWTDLGIFQEAKNIDQMVLDFIFDYQESIETAIEEEYDYGDVISRVSERVDPCMLDLDNEKEFDKFKEILGEKVEAMMEEVNG